MTIIDRQRKQQVRRAFNAAANSYDRAAQLQRHVGGQLSTYLRPSHQALRILDVGCGTGFMSEILLQHYPNATVVAIDIANNMCKIAAQKLPQKHCHIGCADADHLPFSDACFDIVISNLAVQWSPSLSTTLMEIKRILSPAGQLLFSTLGPNTLIELRQSWRDIDQHDHVNDFISINGVREKLSSTLLTINSLTQEFTQTWHPHCIALCRQLKNLGANSVQEKTKLALCSKTAWQSMQQAYEQYRQANQLLPASYEIIYANCRVT